MKIRYSFVSNSSSCSFVVAGFSINNNDIRSKEDMLSRLDEELYEEYLDECKQHDEEDWTDILNECFMDALDKTDFFYCSDPECGSREGKTIFGVILAEISDDDFLLDSGEYSLDDLINETAELKKILPEAKNEDIKIITGTRMC